MLCTQADACGGLSASLRPIPGIGPVERNRDLPRGRFPRASQAIALTLIPSANLSRERRESLWHTGPCYVRKLPRFFHVEEARRNGHGYHPSNCASASRPTASRNQYTTFHVEDSDDDHPIHGHQMLWNAVRNLPRGRREPACS